MKKIVSIIALTLLVTGCGGSSDDKKDDKIIVVGASSTPHAEVLEVAREDIEKAGYKLEIVIFNDYVTPNKALADKDLDANFFQHKPFLDNFNKENKTELESVGSIFSSPIGIYSTKKNNKNANFGINDVSEGAKIAVPNDATNEARALQLLADCNIIELDKNAGLKATKADIIKNLKNIDIIEVEAPNVPTTISEVEYAIVNANYALSGGLAENQIIAESKGNDALKMYANIVAVNKDDVSSEKIKVLVKALKTDKVKQYIDKTYKGLIVTKF